MSTCNNKLYGQCGGVSWTGDTCCPTNSVCKEQNQ